MRKFVVALLAVLTAFSCVPRVTVPNADSISYLGDARAAYLQGGEDQRMQVLRTLADIMADYESIPPENRRDEFERMMRAVLSSTSNERIITIYTIWKPNAVDGMDSRYLGRPGSSPTGQFAAAVSRETGSITLRTSADVQGTMDYINGPNGRKERALDPEARTVQGKEIYVIRFMVPVVNPRTNEVVGSVGAYIEIGPVATSFFGAGYLQTIVENTIKYNDFISAMAVYDNTGFILASYVPDSVGKNLRDADTIYGEHINDAFQAVRRGEPRTYSNYSPVLKSNMQIQLTPFQIGNSDTTWTVMVAATEELTWFRRLFRK